MKNMTRKGILLGIGLLGVNTFISAPASAQPQQRRDVKEARKDVKEAKRDLKDARKDLREEKKDVRRNNNNDQWGRPNHRDDRNRPGYNNPVYGRPGYVRPGVVNRPGVLRRGPAGSGYVRPGYVRPGYVNPAYNRPGVNRPIANAYRTVQGTVTNNLSGNDFNLRLTNGQTVRVLVTGGEPGRLSRGDVVQAYGRLEGGTFRATNATILRNR